MSTPLTLPPHSTPITQSTRSAINAALLSTQQIPRIQATLLHECQAAGFVSALRARVLELLRAGECATYAELMEAVMGEIKGGDGKMGEKGGEKGGKGGEKGAENGVNGAGMGRGKEERLRIPQKVLTQGVDVVKQALAECVVFGEDDG